MHSPTPLQILRENSLPSVVQAEIEQLILSGELAAGQRVNEANLAERFGTSRGPIREALRALEECGLVRSERNRGVFVRQISLQEANEVYDLRELLDEFIGQRLARDVSSAQLRTLEELIAAMQAATMAQDIPRYHALNLEFHDALVDFVGNSHLSTTYRRLTKELLLFRLHGLQEGGGFAVSITEHKAILTAIRSGDPIRAGATLRAHAAESRARMQKAHAQPRADAARTTRLAPRQTTGATDTPTRGIS
jgi:phosphonate utilization transcriptional regulator